VFLASKTLLFSRGDDAAVLDESGGGVVVKAGDAEDSHGVIRNE
jgi:hypothetical protein